MKTASPTAVVGRFPTGFLTKKSKRFAAAVAAAKSGGGGEVRRQRMVPPLAVGEAVLRRLPPGVSLAVTKIDVEGYEIQALEALRPAWSRAGDLLVEVQPRAWALQNVTVPRALRTFREFVGENGYRIVSLAHEGLGRKSETAIRYPDVCTLPAVPAGRAVAQAQGKWRAPRAGRAAARGGFASRVGGAARLDLDGLSQVLEFMLHHPRKMGYFRDFLFTRRTCPDEPGRTGARS